MTDVKSEALRYLGYRGAAPDSSTTALLDRAYDELRAAAAPLYCCKLTYKDEARFLLSGGDIEEHLSGSAKVIFFAATLGSGADRVIRTAEVSNMAYAVIADAVASAMTEELCDAVEKELHERFGGYFTWRYSPGYGDYPISVQSALIRYLNADKQIGLTVTDSDILIPRKSVTAVIGVSDTEQGRGTRPGCANCGMRDRCVASGAAPCGR